MKRHIALARLGGQGPAGAGLTAPRSDRQKTELRAIFGPKRGNGFGLSTPWRGSAAVFWLEGAARDRFSSRSPAVSTHFPRPSPPPTTSSIPLCTVTAKASISGLLPRGAVNSRAPPRRKPFQGRPRDRRGPTPRRPRRALIAGPPPPAPCQDGGVRRAPRSERRAPRRLLLPTCTCFSDTPQPGPAHYRPALNHIYPAGQSRAGKGPG
ncbi:hypothetical protein SKAU_G00057120 [Synaphobranchus kaupii]|uniref:Uncharacterized protein n=1 Tax=Synaphobranchus kaupii TaxID=118154 RepID=A0A9Q1G575_SYNKA|nr:hypothetical protein SKAU_G00057120 [Synaphobranchus kaupii]